MTLYSLLNNAVTQYSQNRALKTESGQWLTFKEIGDIAVKLSSFLKKNGVPDGGTVLLDMPKDSRYAAAILACLLKGYCIVPVNYDYPEDRKQTIRTDSRADFTLTKELYDAALLVEPDTISEGSFEPKENAIAVYIFTSGSTGKPKGVMLDQQCIAEQVIRNNLVLKLTDEDVWGQVASFTFIAGIEEILAAFTSGAGALLIDGMTVRNPEALAEFYFENGVTASFIPPRVLKFFKPKSEKIKLIVAASERLTGVTPSGYRLLNEYGQSELCGASLFFEVDKAYDNTPIGKPFDGLFAYVLDENGNEAETGELCISGHFFSGYVDLPEQTAKVLVKNPFAEKDGWEMMVRTGDIVRREPDGNIVYINRNDWMIKLNGQRVEPGEIENVILKVNGIKEAAVKDFKNESGQIYICAYICGDADADTVKEEISKKLPSYMIPAFFVKLPELPKNANGKLDRMALKAPDANAFKAEYVAPSTDEEKLICEAFEKVLNLERVGALDDFFAIGGDSIKTIEAAGLCESIHVTTDMILRGRTPRGIAALIKDAQDTLIQHSETIPETCPMTDSQKGVYFECLEEPESLKYNIPAYIKLPKDIDIAAYEEAIKKVFSAHPALSVKAKEIDYIPSMIYEKQEAIINHSTANNLEEKLADFTRPFDLKNDSLYRFEICSVGDENYFLFDFHHIIFDGTSLQVFVSQLGAAYKGEEIEPEGLNIFDISSYEKDLHETEKYAEALKFFDNKLSDADSQSGPLPDRLDEDRDEKGAGCIEISTEEMLTADAALEYTRNNAITENTLFLGAFAYTIAKLNGAESSSFSSANSGRHDPRLKNSVGMFVKTLPLYYEIDEKQSITNFLSMVQKDFFDTMCHDCVSLGDIAKNHNITENITFVYQSDMLNGAVEIDPGEISAPICVMVFRKGNAYRINVRFYNSLYSHELMESFAQSYAQIVKQMMTVESLSDIDILTDSQKALLDEFNATEVAYDDSKTVIDLFTEQVKANPENIAVIFDGKEFTYAQVDKTSQAIAAYLSKEGIRKGDVVSILIPRCEYMATASLGVLKCGAAYQPLDSTYPDERLAFMMKDSEAKLLIADESLMEKVPDWKGKVLYTKDIPQLEEKLEGELKEALTNITAPSPEDLFILLYTSGSTGVPKGCMISHGNIAAFSNWCRRYFNLVPESRVAAYASYGFDANMMDMYPTLTTGAAVVIIREDMRFDMLRLNNYFKETKITNCLMTTQVGRQFAQICDSEYLKHLSVGGETLVPLCVDKGFTLYNLYGPTENTIVTTAFPVRKKYRRVPIGKALDNNKLYVLDKYMHRLPAGAVGELYISGKQVSQGYLNRPEKTAEAYLSNPFESEAGYERLYRAGDVVRFLPDGNIDFIGRNDGQVKIRGFRIELSEIEEVIRRYPGIKDATVAAFDAHGGGKFVAAYIAADTPIDISALNSFIGETKPPYMIPAVTMQIDEIPLNQNMKVNKKALPVPEFKAADMDLTPPKTETEKQLFEIVSKMLGNDKFGIYTDFAEIGMTSIMSIQLITEIGEQIGATVNFSDMKQYGCINSLARYINENESEDENFPVLDEYSLTKTQMGIFAECIARPESAVYNIPVIIGLNEAIEIDKLKSAIVSAVNAHPYILTTLKYNEKGEVIQLRNPEAFAEEEIRVETKSDLDAVKNEMLSAFDLIGGRLFYFGIFTAADTGERYFVLNIHHIISDGTSINILLRDITRAYKGAELKTETYSGFEISLTEKKLCESKVYEEAKAFYKEMLSGCEGCAIPPRTMHSEVEKSAPFTYISGVNADEYRKYCESCGITMNTLFNAAFALALGKYVHSEDIAYCTIYNGRNDSRMSAVVSMLVKTFPVRIDWDKDTKVSDYLKRMEKTLLQCMTNDSYSFAEISHDYHIDADILYSYQGDNFELNDFCGYKCSEISLDLDDSKAPLDISVEIKNNLVMVNGTYRSDLFDKVFVDAFAKSIDTAALQLMKAEKLCDISIADDADILKNRSLNDIKYPVPDEPIHRMFERQVELHPEKTAVIDNDGELSFAALNEKCNILANKLLRLGMKKDEIIGFICERSNNVFIGEYGILKAGGAFLPMVPEYPDDRISYCLTDAGCRKLVVSREVYEAKEDLIKSLDIQILVIEDILENAAEAAYTKNPEINIPTDSLCYCI